MSGPSRPSGYTTTVQADCDDDVIIIEPEIPIIDLCTTPCPNTNKWSRSEGLRSRQLAVRPKPEVKAQIPRSDSDSIRCAICLLSPLDRNPQATRCGHVFCGQCIRQALIVKKECPICRKFTCSSFTIPLHI